MTTTTLLIIAVAVIAAYILKSLTGFGTSLILVPVLSAFLGIKDAVVISALGDVISSGMLAFRDGKHVTFSQLKEIGAGVFLGTVVGVSILNLINATLLRHALAVFIICYILIQQFAPVMNFSSEKTKKFAAYALGFIGGVCGGIFNTNGPAIVLYMKSAFTSKETIRANMVMIFLIDSIWRTSLYGITDMVTAQNLLLFATIILPTLVIGIYIGTKIDKQLHANHYTTLSKIVLILSGVKLLFS